MTQLWLALAAGSLAAIVAILLAERLRRRRDEAQAYLKGVRSIVQGDPDAAIEALSDAARLGTPEAVDTYLALGALFRREGDLARAVRLHRNMLLGRGLDPARRAEVERELAEDYRRSGMLAEAAELYARLAEGDGDRAAAEGLRDVRVEQGDLAGAVALQRRLGPGDGDPVLAHLLAAQAREALRGDPAQAAALAREGLAAHPRSADAWMALAEAEAAAGATAAALDAAGRSLEEDPRAALLAWPALAAVPDAAAAEAFAAARAAARPDDPALHLLHGRALHRCARNPEAVAALRLALERDRVGEVSLAMRELLHQAAAPGPDDLAARHDLLVAALLRRGKAPRCERCGSDAPSRAWRCRRCGAFDAYP
ncbi:tetratricopeptide repeat protein [Anaeromyxobacter dehalogenans 2CP-1]|uniref:Tetratricopeptide repeat protein n=1 Tax=Anaeromyxobacter dehalogenans (strain ATCC BAA-258 / DSM 21875 / 2CP-1) TaxID=455488 RepID=B8JBE3_ANAD2|nr:tetratricopeptide repeat protein [Anaeromyxobacter dehalogenans]ACL65770.1 tetratricopeptide repeat protein [Anaeromyxobacter dehalogenans 2CP-1]